MMKLGLVLGAACALLLIATVARANPIDAKDSDFDQILAMHPLTLVKFYAPWCGHCKRLAPEWDTAAAKVAGKAGLVRLDCTVETETAAKYGIKSYPTIKVFQDGVLIGDYDGARSAEAIVQYVEVNLGPAVTPVSDAAQLATLKAENDMVVVAYVADEGTTVAATHAAAARQLRNRYRFARVVDPALFDGAAETIVVYKNFDEPKVVYTGDVTSVAELSQFLSATSVKLFDEIGPENYKVYVARKLPIAWLFVRPSEEAAADSLKKIGASVAPSFAGKISFVWVDGEKYGGMAERLGVRKGHMPAFVIDDNGAHFVFPEDQAIEKAAIEAFTQTVVDGTAKRTIRTEEAPEVHTKDGLTTVVGSTFTDLVVNSGRDTLIEFFAPWCGHCKKLQPIYEEVAKHLKDVDGIRVAQIDASANDIDPKLFNVNGFPTIYFVPLGGSPVLYEGPRTFQGLLSFLKEKSTVAFEMPPEDREL